jgi:hypothetical protein
MAKANFEDDYVNIIYDGSGAWVKTIDLAKFFGYKTRAGLYNRINFYKQNIRHKILKKSGKKEYIYWDLRSINDFIEELEYRDILRDDFSYLLWWINKEQKIPGSKIAKMLNYSNDMLPFNIIQQGKTGISYENTIKSIAKLLKKAPDMMSYFIDEHQHLFIGRLLKKIRDNHNNNLKSDICLKFQNA